MTPLLVEANRHTVSVLQDGRAVLTMSWPEANKLQADLRRACVAAGITLRDAL
jgi:hypothetical protein